MSCTVVGVTVCEECDVVMAGQLATFSGTPDPLRPFTPGGPFPLMRLVLLIGNMLLATPLPPCAPMTPLSLPLASFHPLKKLMLPPVTLQEAVVTVQAQMHKAETECSAAQDRLVRQEALEADLAAAKEDLLSAQEVCMTCSSYRIPSVIGVHHTHYTL